MEYDDTGTGGGREATCFDSKNYSDNEWAEPVCLDLIYGFYTQDDDPFKEKWGGKALNYCFLNGKGFGA